jgi:hypothetical protein
MVRWIVLLAALGLIWTNDERQFEMKDSMDPIIMESIGTVLKPLGYLASGADPVFASIFMSIPTPEISRNSCQNSQEICTPDMTWLKNSMNASPTSFVGLDGANDPEMLGAILECVTECIRSGDTCKSISLRIANHQCTKMKFAPDNTVPQSQKESFAARGGLIGVTVADFGDYTELCSRYLTPIEHKLAKLYREDMQKDIKELWNSSREAYNNLVKAYQLETDVEAADEEGQHRRKRSVAGAAVAGIGGFALGGLFATIYEGFQTRKYIHRLEKRFNEFTQETTMWMENQQDFNTEIVAIYKSIHEELDQLSCDVDIIAHQLLKEKKFKRWQELTRTILSGVLKNELTIGVLPEILTLKNIKTLVESEIFRGTIYTKTPEAIFTQGKLTLVNMTKTESSWRYHFVLSAPALKSSSLYNRYEVEQVGFQQNGTCVTLEAPKEVYKIGNSFYEVTDDICFDRSHVLKICSKPSNDKSTKTHKSVPCLNKEETCQIHVVPCNTKACFTTAGVLAFSEERIRGVPIGADIAELDIIGDPRHKTSFYSWENYTTLLVGNRIITSVKQPTLHVTLEIPSTTWEEFITKRTRENQRKNLDQLTGILETQESQTTKIKELSRIFSDNPILKSGGTGNFLLWAGVAALISLSVAIGVAVCVRMRAKSNKYKKEARRPEPMPMMPMMPMMGPINYPRSQVEHQRKPIEYVNRPEYKVLDVQVAEDDEGPDKALDVTLSVDARTTTNWTGTRDQRPMKPKTRAPKKVKEKIKCKSLEDLIDEA